MRKGDELDCIGKPSISHTAIPFLLIGITFMTAILAGCDLANQSVASNKALGDRDTMNSTAPVLNDTPKIPPIEAHALRTTETATFALG